MLSIHCRLQHFGVQLELQNGAMETGWTLKTPTTRRSGDWAASIVRAIEHKEDKGADAHVCCGDAMSSPTVEEPANKVPAP